MDLKLGSQFLDGCFPCVLYTFVNVNLIIFVVLYDLCLGIIMTIVSRLVLLPPMHPKILTNIKDQEQTHSVKPTISFDTQNDGYY